MGTELAKYWKQFRQQFRQQKVVERKINLEVDMRNVCMWIKKERVEGRRKQMGYSRAPRKEAARRQPVKKRRRGESIRRTWSALTTF